MLTVVAVLKDGLLLCPDLWSPLVYLITRMEIFQHGATDQHLANVTEGAQVFACSSLFHFSGKLHHLERPRWGTESHLPPRPLAPSPDNNLGPLVLI